MPPPPHAITEQGLRGDLQEPPVRFIRVVSGSPLGQQRRIVWIDHQAHLDVGCDADGQPVAAFKRISSSSSSCWRSGLVEAGGIGASRRACREVRRGVGEVRRAEGPGLGRSPGRRARCRQIHSRSMEPTSGCSYDTRHMRRPWRASTSPRSPDTRRPGRFRAACARTHKVL